MDRQRKWDLRFLRLAEHISQWSKDPSTKCGSVIVDPDGRVVSVGYNGFPRGVIDSDERLLDRDTKYRMTVHCEINAIMFAGHSLTGCTLYTWPMVACSNCVAVIIQSGIARHVAPTSDHPRFGEAAQALSLSMMREAGIALELIPVDEIYSGVSR
ncbi:MAG TPA: deaminase [Alphaproteobacteria bacterium]|nr:deaminase [Alphaproteobacteria bacterium]